MISRMISAFIKRGIVTLVAVIALVPTASIAANLPLPGPPVLIYTAHGVNGLTAEPPGGDAAALNTSAIFFGTAATGPSFAPPASTLLSGNTPSTFDGQVLDLTANGNQFVGLSRLTPCNANGIFLFGNATGCVSAADSNYGSGIVYEFVAAQSWPFYVGSGTSSNVNNGAFGFSSNSDDGSYIMLNPAPFSYAQSGPFQAATGFTARNAVVNNGFTQSAATVNGTATIGNAVGANNIYWLTVEYSEVERGQTQWQYLWKQPGAAALQQVTQGVIYGQVRNNGVAVPNASVTLTDPAGAAHALTTDVNGYYGYNFNPVTDAPGGWTSTRSVTVAATDTAAHGSFKQSVGVGLAMGQAQVQNFDFYEAKLTVAKTGPATANAGDIISYAINVSNAGPAAANGTVLNDSVPTTLTGVTTTCGSPTAGAACPASVAAGNNVTASIPTLPSGGSVIFTVTGRASTAGSITNTATIAFGPTANSPEPANSVGVINADPTSILTSSQATTIAPSAALTISKSAPANVGPGELLAYTIVVSNAGPSPADGATFGDTVPTGLAIKGTPTCAAAGGAICGTVTTSGQNVTSTITTLPSGSSVTFTIDTTTTTAATYTNTATIAPPSGTSDPNVRTSTATTTVGGNGISKTVRNVTSSGSAVTANGAVPNDILEYAVTYTNLTGSSITAFAFRDATPTPTTFVSIACGALPTGITSCTTTQPAVGNTGTVSWAFAGTLASGATLTASFRVRVP